MDTKQWIREELVCLWNDFFESRNSTIGGPYILSIKMLGILDRIQEATEIVGHVEWSDIGGLYLAEGSYKGICEAFSIPYNFPTGEEYAELVEPHWGKMLEWHPWADIVPRK